MERPIESKSLGEAFATSFKLEMIASECVQLTFCRNEFDGDVYERARIIMPRSLFDRLRRSEAAPLAFRPRGQVSHLQ